MIFSIITICSSVFDGGAIPYPKREFIKDDEPDDNPDTGASKVGGQKVSMPTPTPTAHCATIIYASSQ